MTRICRLQLQPQAGLISRVPLFIYAFIYLLISLFSFSVSLQVKRKVCVHLQGAVCADLLSQSPNPLQLRTLDALLYIHSL